MTDNKIIKALKELLETALYNGDLQSAETISKALDLINRQKAEIERLKDNYDKAMDNLKSVLEERADHSEAIKEFWQKLKEKNFYEFFGEGCEGYLIRVEDGENLVKEMIGE